MTKLEKLRSSLKEKGIDAVVVLDPLNIRYLCDFSFHDGMLAISQNKAELITDFRYFEMAELGASKDFNIVMPEKRFDYIKKVFSEDGVKVVGLEGEYMSYASYKMYEKGLDVFEIVDIENLIEVLRQIKTPDELLLMQKAQDITDKAFSQLLSVITPEMTEMDVAVELEYAMRKNGANAFAFDTIAVSGDASALPHGTPRNVKLKRGFLTMDFGAKFDDYCSDMTRTIVIGKADAEIKKLYNTVLTAQLSAIDFLREGVDAGEADKVARDIIDKNEEYRGAFGHSLGHAIGLYVHEAPGMSVRAFGKKLVCGNVVSVEPGIYLHGKYGCRIEDMVAIEKDGVHNFTHSTKELIEIL